MKINTIADVGTLCYKLDLDVSASVVSRFNPR